MIELDKEHLVPNWLIKGLEVANKIINKNISNNIDQTEKIMQNKYIGKEVKEIKNDKK